MATTTLTPKQQQVKGLLEQGKTPAEVAKKLKVNVNSVYQHIRRMKAAEGETAAKPKRTARKSTARKAGGKRTTARKSTARKSTRRSTTRRPARPRPTPPAPAPVAEVRQMTPLQAIRHRREHIEAEIRESAKRLEAATKAFENEADAHGKLEGSRAAELKQLAQAEAALSDAKPKPKRSRSGASKNGAGSKAAGKAAAQAAAPAATPEPQSAATPGPDPTPAESAGTTGSTTDAPEPVEPPTGDEALAAVGAEQERPGAETLPEFQQPEGEDPFAG